MEKMIAVNTKQPKEIVDKLEKIANETGKSKSKVVRDLIASGKVNAVTNGVELAKILVHVRNDVNTAKLQITDDLNGIRDMIRNGNELNETSELAKSIENTLGVIENYYSNRNAEGKIKVITRIICDGE